MAAYYSGELVGGPLDGEWHGSKFSDLLTPSGVYVYSDATRDFRFRPDDAPDAPSTDQ